MPMVLGIPIEALLISKNVDRPDQFGFKQRVERIVNRGAGKNRVFFGKRIVNGICRWMGVMGQQIIKNSNTLLCRRTP